MAKGCATNNKYEEARKQRLEENKKRFEDLGISTISKNLSEITTPLKKTPHHLPKLRSKTNEVVEPRRSARVRNTVPSYREDVSIGLPALRKRSRSNSSSWGSYIARPLDEIKEATEEQRIRALEAAEELQINLQSKNPSFIKSMVRSHVYSCFWLGLPSKFCEEHLPKTVYDMILEDENGLEYEAVYIGKRSGLSGGWRAFALEHKLDDGDALVFELIEAARFKIYIVKAFPDSNEEDGKESLEEGENMRATKEPKLESESKKTKKPKQTIVRETNELASPQEHLPERSTDNEVKPQGRKPTKKTKVSQKKLQKKSNMPATGESKGEAQVETGKPMAAIKHKSEANKTRKDKEESKGEAQVETVKPKAIKHKSEANKTRKSKEGGIVHEIGESDNTQQPLSGNNLVKPQGSKPGKKNGYVQDACELKKVEPVEEATTYVSQKPRKKAAPKLFRKKA